MWSYIKVVGSNLFDFGNVFGIEVCGIFIVFIGVIVFI